MDFGFKISPSSAVNLDNVDLTLYNRLLETEPDISKCIACGSCMASCPANRFSGMSVRKAILNLQRGKGKETAAMLSGCMLCGKCTMVCPRGINTRHLILAICRLYREDAQ